MAGIEQAISEKVMEAAKMVEEQVDNELDRLENLTQDDLEDLREKRLEHMKKMAAQRQEWIGKGHGQYHEIRDEKDFFDEAKDCPRVICHFYRDSTFRCKIVDKHLAALAPKHLEAKFIKLNAEKSPFLVQRLRIVVLPTIAIIKEGKTGEYIVGFDELGGVDDFPTEMMEWRLGKAGVINYNGDLSEPPFKAGGPKKDKNLLLNPSKKTIRGRVEDDSDDDDY